MNNDESKKLTIDTGNSAVAGSCQFERVLGSARTPIDFEAYKEEVEGGKNMRDMIELSSEEMGEIIWQHKCNQTAEYIATRLKVKLWQLIRYIKDVENRASASA
jgi:hypothetical protein